MYLYYKDIYPLTFKKITIQKNMFISQILIALLLHSFFSFSLHSMCYIFIYLLPDQVRYLSIYLSCIPSIAPSSLLHPSPFHFLFIYSLPPSLSYVLPPLSSPSLFSSLLLSPPLSLFSLLSFLGMSAVGDAVTVVKVVVGTLYDMWIMYKANLVELGKYESSIREVDMLIQELEGLGTAAHSTTIAFELSRVSHYIYLFFSY